MTNNLQKEIPKSRINITMDVESDGAHKKKELPLKLLILADFSNNKLEIPLSKQERINIDQNNFNKVLGEIGPTMFFDVPNKIKDDGSLLNVKIKTSSYKSFYPEEIAKQVPELQKLLAMRNILKDLKANLSENRTLKQELEAVLANKKHLQELQGKLQKKSSLE